MQLAKYQLSGTYNFEAAPQQQRTSTREMWRWGGGDLETDLCDVRVKSNPITGLDRP